MSLPRARKIHNQLSWVTRMRGLHFLPLLMLVALTALAENPDKACAPCHQKIYDSYQATPMARASGSAADGLLPGDFTHAGSGVHYRLFLRDGRAWLSYDRPNAPQ